MKYRNAGHTTVICYGVEFKPGQIKDVPGVISLRNFVQVKDIPKSAEKPSPNGRSSRKYNKVSEPNIKSKEKVDSDTDKVEIVKKESE